MSGQRGPNDQIELSDTSRESYREKYVRFLLPPAGRFRSASSSSELGAISPEVSPEGLFVPLSARRILPPSDVLFFEDKGDKDEQDTQRISAHRQELTVHVNNLLQELEKTRHLVILGGTGAGKTTLTRFLAHTFASGKGREETGISEPLIPILINLGRYSRTLKQDEELPFIDYVCATLADQHQDIPAEFFTWHLERGLCIVLLEGLNEAKGIHRPAIVSQIERLARRYRNSRFVVTSQIAGYRSAPLHAHDFRHYTLLDFNDDQISASLSKQLALVYGVPEEIIPPRISAFMEYLKLHPGARHLAANPLMLSMMAALQSAEALPSQRGQLYERYTRLLARRKNELTMRRRLECIAWYLHTSPYDVTGEGEAEIDTLQDVLSRYLRDEEKLPDAEGEARTFLDRMCRQTHILVDRGREQFGFVHRTFQNYFVACHLVPGYGETLSQERYAAVQQHIIKHLHQGHWEDVARLTIARLHSDQATAVVRAILYEQHSWKETLLRRDLLFCAALLIEGADIAHDMALFVISELGIVATDERYRQRRQDAIDTIAGLAASEHRSYRSLALGTLTRLLTHPGISVRESAAEALVLVGDGPVRDQALAVLRANTASEFATVRLDAIRGLYAAGKVDEAKHLLIELAQNASVYVEVRRNAAIVLWIWGLEEAAHAVLADLAKDATHGRVSVEAAEALGQTGDMAGAANMLVLLARIQHNSAVQWYAAHALTNLAKRNRDVVDRLAQESRYLQPYDSQDDGQVARVLVHLFKQQPDFMQKVMVADALGYFRHGLAPDVQADVQESLRTWATGFGDWFVRVAAAQVLITWDDATRAFHELLRLAESAANQDAREAATRVLGGMRSEEAVLPLVRLAGAATGVHVDIPHAAAESLGRLGYPYPQVLRRLSDMAEGADTFSGEAAYLALLKLRPPAQLPAS